jgi:hypothetical protein
MYEGGAVSLVAHVMFSGEIRTAVNPIIVTIPSVEIIGYLPIPS